MGEWFEALKPYGSLLGVIVGAIVAISALPKLIFYLRESGLRISLRKSRDLDTLLRNYEWLKQPPHLLQRAIARDCGRSIDERDFKFIQTRRNPQALFRLRIASGQLVCVDEDARWFAPSEGPMKRFVIGKHGELWLYVLWVPFILVAALVSTMLVTVGASVTAYLGAVVFAIYAALSLWFTLWLASAVAAAKQLLANEAQHPHNAEAIRIIEAYEKQSNNTAVQLDTQATEKSKSTTEPQKPQRARTNRNTRRRDSDLEKS